MISLFVSKACEKNEKMVRFKVWLIFNHIDFNLITVDPKNDPTEFKNACEGSDNIVIVGGVGTVNSVVNATRSLGIRYGLIPAGDDCDFAKALNLVGIDESKLFRVALKGRTTDLDVWSVNGTNIFCSYLTIGASSLNGFHVVGDDPAYLGDFKGAFSGARFKVTAENGDLISVLSLLSVQNIPTIGGGFVMNRDSRYEDGFFEAVCVKTSANPFRSMLNGRAMKGEGLSNQGNVVTMKSSKIRIRCDQPEVCLIDGIAYKLNIIDISFAGKVYFGRA